MGRFRIPEDIIRKFPSFARDVLEGKMIVEASTSFASRAVEYVAFCHDFEKIPAGEEESYYDLQFDFVEVPLDIAQEYGYHAIPQSWSLVRLF